MIGEKEIEGFQPACLKRRINHCAIYDFNAFCLALPHCHSMKENIWIIDSPVTRRVHADDDHLWLKPFGQFSGELPDLGEAITCDTPIYDSNVLGQD